jgi:hypothetical protein
MRSTNHRSPFHVVFSTSSLSTPHIFHSTLFTKQLNTINNSFYTRKIYRVEVGYNDLGLCDISSITLHILGYQLIPHETSVFFSMLSTTNIRASISAIMTLPIIGYNINLQEIEYSENSTVFWSFKRQGLLSA